MYSFENIKDKSLNIFSNLISWKSRRKIIVFESDDWGMIRTSSLSSYKNLTKKGYLLDRCNFSKNDALETNSDIQGLLEILSQFKNREKKSPIFTLNNVVANPDFEKIENSGFSKYFRESFIDTYKKYDNSENVFSIIKQGVENELFMPQYHGTEHVNVNRWMKSLQNNDNKSIRDAFEEGMYTIYPGKPTTCHEVFLDTFGIKHFEEFETMESIIKIGLTKFKEIWGMNSKSFIAPCYIWPTKIEKFLFENNVKYIQGTRVQRNSVNDERIFTKKYHYTGQRNDLSQIYLVRNVTFEPTLQLNSNCVDNALKEIDLAFKYKVPAIISSHRINYIGRLNSKNRDHGLNSLSLLIENILAKWPEVEFLSTSQLGDLILNSKS